MIQIQLLFTINLYTQRHILMSKKPYLLNSHTQKERKGKKQIDDEILARYEKPKLEGPDRSSSRRRLKKLCEVNQSEELLLRNQEQEDNQTEKLDDYEEKEDYHQFQIKDDEELIKEKEKAQLANNSKKLKGNQTIDKFLQKGQAEPFQKKEGKKGAKAGTRVQMTLDQMAIFKKEKKNNRKESSDVVVSDNAEISQNEEKMIETKRLAAYAQYNGSMQDEAKLIQKAKKLSLTASSFQQDYSYSDEQNKDKQKKDEPKQQTKQKNNQKQDQGKKEVKQKKQQQKYVKQAKTMPLAGFIISTTGLFQNFEKDELIEVLQQLGAQCPKSFTKKCNLLIQGSFVLDQYKRHIASDANNTKKTKDAIERGVRIIPNEEIDNFFIAETGKSLSAHLYSNKTIVPINPLNNLMNKQIDNELHEQQVDDFIRLKSENKKKQQMKVNPERRLKIESQSQEQRPQNNGHWQILWTQKYKPNSLQEVIGQKSQIKSLREWIQNWEDIQLRGNKREVRQARGYLPSGNINSKAALLSGDPGLGKTTTARLLAMEYNYGLVQFNASDIRNKSGVALLQSNSYGLDMSKNLQKSIIIMDQVDGMSSGDRGGITSIIAMIQNTKVPIICICNDRFSSKIRSLAAHCLDIKFHKPQKPNIVKRLRQIIQKQGGTAEERAIERLVETFQNDMRQLLSYLQVVFHTVSKRITLNTLSGSGGHAKDSSVMINHFDASRKLMNKVESRFMSIQDRVNCFFIDSDLVPLMVHENILASSKKGKMNQSEFHSLVQGLKGFVVGDMIDKHIRKQQAWGLMPAYGFMSCVYTTQKISESLGFPLFPSWLGKNSTERKNKRLIKQIKNHVLPTTLCGSSRSFKMSYVPILFKQIIQLLKKDEVQLVLQFMDLYKINPTILNEHLLSLQYNPNKINLFENVQTATKSKLTRLYNKRHEQAKLKAAKGGAKSKNQHLKFDPVLEQVEDLAVYEEEQEEQMEKEEVPVKNRKDKAKPKK